MAVPAVTPTETAPPLSVVTPDEPGPLIVPPVESPSSTAVAPPVPPKVTVKPRPAPPKPPRVTVQTLVYGHSALGQPLTATILDNGPQAKSDVTLIFGGFHGNERSTPDVVRQLQPYLLQNPTLWRERRVVLVPVANPDGWAAATRVNAHNVDLNRNFPADWSCTGRAARNNPGPAPASEPETRAMISLLRELHPQKVVSLHSPLHCLNWTGPVGKEMADAMTQLDHYPATSDIGYPTPGSLGEYCGSQGIGIVTLELPDISAPAAWSQNRAALLAAIQIQVPKQSAKK